MRSKLHFLLEKEIEESDSQESSFEEDNEEHKFSLEDLKSKIEETKIAITNLVKNTFEEESKNYDQDSEYVIIPQ